MFDKVYRIMKVVVWFLLLFVTLILIFAAIYYNNGNVILTSESNKITFFDCLYFSTITFLTVGYGDILPYASFSKLISSIEGYLGILYGILFSGFLLNEIFSIKVEELKNIVKRPIKLPKYYDCFPKDIDVMPIKNTGNGNFEIDFSESSISWCSTVIFIGQESNWAYLAEKGYSLSIRARASGLNKISIEIKDDLQRRVDNHNLQLSFDNQFTLLMKLSDIYEQSERWKAISEVCFVVTKDMTLGKCNFEIIEAAIVE